jgi:hypothetical protein
VDELLINNRPHLYVEGNPVGFRDESGNATKRSCRDARDLCATFNTLGTTIADAAITVVGSVLFSTANFISGVETSIKKKRIRL